MIDETRIVRNIKAVIRKIKKSKNWGMECIRTKDVVLMLETILNTIAESKVEQPTIQPQASINRGKWIRYEDTHEESVKYICPFCGDYTAFRGEISESTVNGNYIYCRHCGAKNGEDQ